MARVTAGNRLLLRERESEEGVLDSVGLKWHLDSSCSGHPRDPQPLQSPWRKGEATGVVLDV